MKSIYSPSLAIHVLSTCMLESNTVLFMIREKNCYYILPSCKKYFLHSKALTNSVLYDFCCNKSYYYCKVITILIHACIGFICTNI